MTVRLGVLAGGSAARVSGRSPARAAVERLSRADRVARARTPGRWPRWTLMPSSPGWRDPVGLLLSQAASRVPELVPIRHGRMLVSPYRVSTGARR